MKLSDYLEQSDLFLSVKKDCVVIIDLNYYDVNDNLIIDEDSETIWVKSLVAKIIFSDEFEFDMVLDYAIELKINKMEKTKEEIKLYYNAEDVLLEQSLETQDIGKQINYVQRLLGGKEIVKDINHLLLKLKDVYAPHSNMDLVHMEVLLSNILRDKTDPSLPARLGKTWDPQLINIKEIIFKSGFLQSLNFENLSKSLMYGLIQEKPTPKSIMEKILIGEIHEHKKGNE